MTVGRLKQLLAECTNSSDFTDDTDIVIRVNVNGEWITVPITMISKTASGNAMLANENVQYTSDDVVYESECEHTCVHCAEAEKIETEVESHYQPV